jgi:hypothetical protein
MLQIISTKILLLYNDIKNNQKDQKKFIHKYVKVFPYHDIRLIIPSSNFKRYSI